MILFGYKANNVGDRFAVRIFANVRVTSVWTVATKEDAQGLAVAVLNDNSKRSRAMILDLETREAIIIPNPKYVERCHHDYHDGDVCSKCDQVKS